MSNALEDVRNALAFRDLIRDKDYQQLLRVASEAKPEGVTPHNLVRHALISTMSTKQGAEIVSKAKDDSLPLLDPENSNLKRQADEGDRQSAGMLEEANSGYVAGLIANKLDVQEIGEIVRDAKTVIAR